MEQKMILPALIFAILAGFLIWFNTTGGFDGKNSAKISEAAMSSITNSPYFIEPGSEFVVRAGFFEDLRGTVKSIGKDGWVLASPGGRELKLPARTVFFRQLPSKNNPQQLYNAPMSMEEVKVGDTFLVTVRYDVKDGSLLGVLALKEN